MSPLKERIILDGAEINRILNRIAHEVIERNKGITDMAIIGIRRCGVHLADRLARRIEEIEGHEILRGILDITLYRDDLSGMREQPVVNSTEIPFPVNGKRIILVDDVLFTGRTVRAALDNVMDFGRPLLIQLAVLIDRGHRELPISADYIGKTLPTSRKEKVKVLLREEGEEDKVVIYGT